MCGTVNGDMYKCVLSNLLRSCKLMYWYFGGVRERESTVPLAYIKTNMWMNNSMLTNLYEHPRTKEDRGICIISLRVDSKIPVFVLNLNAKTFCPLQRQPVQKPFVNKATKI